MATVVSGDFEWDDAKASANLRKHGVTFDEAATVFADLGNLVFHDPRHVGRFWALGFSGAARMLVVVHVEAGEYVRIISARKAENHEAKLYSAG